MEIMKVTVGCVTKLKNSEFYFVEPESLKVKTCYINGNVAIDLNDKEFCYPILKNTDSVNEDTIYAINIEPIYMTTHSKKIKQKKFNF